MSTPADHVAQDAEQVREILKDPDAYFSREYSQARRDAEREVRGFLRRQPDTDEATRTWTPRGRRQSARERENA